MNLEQMRVLSNGLCEECQEKTTKAIQERFRLGSSFGAREMRKMVKGWKEILEIIEEEACKECNRRVLEAARR